MKKAADCAATDNRKNTQLTAKRGPVSFRKETGPRFLRFGGSDMKANTSIDTTATVNGTGNPASAAEQVSEVQNVSAEQAPSRGKPESELRAAARRKGLTLKELADKMGVSYGYLSQVSSGSRSWSPMLRERAMAVLGEVPGQGVVYRQGGVATGAESTCIRERAREVGLSMGALAALVGVSRSYMSMASRGKRHFSRASRNAA